MRGGFGRCVAVAAAGIVLARGFVRVLGFAMVVVVGGRSCFVVCRSLFGTFVVVGLLLHNQPVWLLCWGKVGQR